LLRVHKRVRPVVVAAPVYTWTGFYVGGNAGYSWGTLSNNWNLFAQSIVLAGCPPAGVAFCETGSDVTRLNGALGGLQAGYNWQTGNFLAGIETDLQLANQRGSNVLNFPAQAVTGGAATHLPGRDRGLQ
jgi:outer membrane immunogenic protein